MDCPRCGASAPQGQRFCSDCGAPLVPWHCAACGTDNAPGRRYCGNCGTAIDHAVVRNEIAAAPAGERRQLTVMFCDMVGSTAIGARLDPEDLRDVVEAYHRCVTEHVTRRGGFVARYMGDGVLIYFGYPVANEDDAERAVRAGLAVVEAVRSPEHRRRTAVDAACTGRYRNGHGHRRPPDRHRRVARKGSGRRRAESCVTPAVPRRTGTVVIDDSTRRLIGGLFDYRDIGTREIKGYEQPVRAWRVLRESSIDSRFEALRAGGGAPLFGREDELALLLHRWREVGRAKAVSCCSVARRASASRASRRRWKITSCRSRT